MSEQEKDELIGEIYEYYDFQLLAEHFLILEKQNEILKSALKFYADPYNYTPGLDAMYGNQLNEKAFEALEKIKELKK